MAITSKLIAVRRTDCTTPREAFDPQHIEEIALSILDCGGLIKPITVKRAGTEEDMRYEVVDNALGFWAAVRAREMNPRKGEMVNAMIAEDPKHLRQLELLNAPTTPATPAPAPAPERKRDNPFADPNDAAAIEYARRRMA